MRSRHFLAAVLTLCTLFLLPAAARAEGNAPPPSAGPGAGAPPVPPAPQNSPAPDPGGKIVARNEEEEKKKKAGLLARLNAYRKGQDGMANDLSALQAQIAELKTKLKAFEDGSEVKALQEENKKLREDFLALADYAQTHGLLKEDGAAAPAPVTEPAKVAGQAIEAAVASQLQKLGIKVENLPAATNPAGVATTMAEVEEQLKACKTPEERQAILAKNYELIMRSK